MTEPILYTVITLASLLTGLALGFVIGFCVAKIKEINIKRED